MTTRRALLPLILGFALAATACGLPAAPGARAALKRPAVTRSLGRTMPADYYAPVANMSGPALLQGLNQLVGPHRDLGYDGARDVMFADVDDLDGDDTVACVYIGRALDNVRDRASAFRNGAGLNAEHTWPQSKGAEGSAKADLHHLFPSDVKANSTRGSYPFGEVARVEWAEGGSQLGDNGSGRRVFEPRMDQRGDTARALLYFFTVYGVTGGPDLENFRLEEPTIKRWHEQDPPTTDEKLRNDAVFAVQGNRNPYIDHPEYVARVGGFMQAGAALNARVSKRRPR
ncbi:MAG: endonuclease [Candidatus Sericytochromatia bacterium]|nr:endonuclease [Candidatus Sericytochromatia bacterium]